MSEPKILRLRKHCIPRPNRTASAPYNFVPLPEIVVKAVEDADQLPDHNTYGDKNYPHTGHFEVTLTTRSPLYIRCPLTMSEFLRQGQDEKQPFREQARNTPHFFYTRDPSEPVIPGSSLRGMLRSLLEIVSYGKVDRVTDSPRIFYRAVAASKDDPLGEPYRQLLGRFGAKVRVGYLMKRRDNWYVRPAKKPVDMKWPEKAAYLKVKEDRIPKKAIPGFLPLNSPHYRPQYHPVSFDVQVRKGKRGGFIIISKIGPPDAGYTHQGVLVCSGNMLETGDEESASPRKRHALVLEADEKSQPVKINPQAVNDYLDALTPFQTEPPFDQHMGCLVHGRPVFYVEKSGEVICFGHNPNFRAPAIVPGGGRAATPLDFVPPELRQPEDIDYAEALFGYTKGGQADAPQGSKSRAYASRVSVTDAVLIEGESDLWLTEDPQDTIVPRILATPKPTAFQHYLVQPEDEKSSLKHYGSSTPCETTIRGLKRYWHQELKGELPRDELRSRIEEDSAILRNIEQQEAKGNPDTQHTQFRPIRPGVRFQFRVYFENLSDRELGALCWVLHPLGSPDKEYCHHLGMGKPLGMGAVKLESVLYVTDRSERYGSLFDRGHWQMGVTGTGQQLSERSILETLAAPFEQHVLGMLKPDKPCTHLSDMKRIAILLKMMEWPGFQPDLPPTPHNRYLTDKHRSNTRYMSIMLPNASANQRNEYRDRPVLPDPSAFGELMGDAEPVPAAKANDKQQVKVIRFSKRSGNPIVKIDNRTLTVLNAPEGIQVGDMIRVDLTAISGTTIGYLDEAER